MAAQPGAWAEAGFHVTGDAAVLGSVVVRLAGSSAGRGIVSWSLRDVASPDLNGLATARSDQPEREPGPAHPNGIEHIDHVVAFSPDLERTVGELEAAGLDLRRVREGPTPAGAQRQAFFRLGEVILELVEHPPGTPAAEDRHAPGHFYGLAMSTADLGATVERLGPLIGEPRDAVQPGRRIATFRREAGLGLPVADLDRGEGAA